MISSLFAVSLVFRLFASACVESSSIEVNPTQSVVFSLTPPSTRTFTPDPTATAAPSPRHTKTPTAAPPTPTGDPIPLATILATPLQELITTWEPYQSERNPISLEHPSSQSPVEDFGVVQFGNGVVVLEQGPLYIGVTVFHFFPYSASYLREDRAVSDPQASLEAMIDFYFQGPWEDEISVLIEPQPITVDGYPAAWAEVRRQTEADERTGLPVDDVYVFAAIPHRDDLVRLQVVSHDQSGVDLLPAYIDKLFQSVRFE
jgi:hypothetical protein